MSKSYTVEDDYAPYLGQRDKSGAVDPRPLPNMEPVDVEQFLSDIASRGHMMEPVWGYSRTEGDSRPVWTQFFLCSYMMSGLDGTGYAVRYGDRGRAPGGYAERAGVYKFAICKHEKVGHSTPRGYHPGKCSKCGFDMTYDSGD